MGTETIEYVQYPLDSVTKHIKLIKGSTHPFIIASGARFQIRVNKWLHMKIPENLRAELYEYAVKQPTRDAYYHRDIGAFVYDFVTVEGVCLDTEVKRKPGGDALWTYSKRYIFLPKTLYSSFVRINSGLTEDTPPLLPMEVRR